MTFRIGELASLTESSVETIRYYEKEGLLPQPLRSSGNYRLYNENHLDRLKFIRHCRSLDMTLGDIRILLHHRDAPVDSCVDVNILLDKHIRAINNRVAELMQLKAHLLCLQQQCTTPSPNNACGILRALSDCSCHELTS